jgi:hypothetical protein
MLGTPETERLEVTALNLFRPTVSPLFNPPPPEEREMIGTLTLLFSNESFPESFEGVDQAVCRRVMGGRLFLVL